MHMQGNNRSRTPACRIRFILPILSQIGCHGNVPWEIEKIRSVNFTKNAFIRWKDCDRKQLNLVTISITVTKVMEFSKGTVFYWRILYISISNVIEIGQVFLRYRGFSIFKTAADRDFGFLKFVFFISWWDPQCRDTSQCQMSSKSVNPLQR